MRRPFISDDFLVQVLFTPNLKRVHFLLNDVDGRSPFAFYDLILGIVRTDKFLNYIQLQLVSFGDQFF